MTVSQLGLDFYLGLLGLCDCEPVGFGYLPWSYRFLVTVSQLGLDIYLGLIGLCDCEPVGFGFLPWSYRFL